MKIREVVATGSARGRGAVKGVGAALYEGEALEALARSSRGRNKGGGRRGAEAKRVADEFWERFVLEYRERSAGRDRVGENAVINHLWPKIEKEAGRFYTRKTVADRLRAKK